MNNDVTAPSVDTDETNNTEITLTLTPKHKLIAKIVGATTVAAGLIVLGARLSREYPSDEEFDVEIEVDEVDNTDD